MERAGHHDGPETVLEMLNRPEGFFAFRGAEQDDILLASKAHTIWVAVDRQAPIADPARLSAARLLGTELVLAGGTTLGGLASVEVPTHQERLLAYLHPLHRTFFAVLKHPATQYVNRGHVLVSRPPDR